MQPVTRPRLLAVLALIAALALVVAGAWGLVGGDDAEPAGADAAMAMFLSRWSAGDDRGAARATTYPDAATAALRATRAGLDGARVSARLGRVTEQGDAARATADVEWTVPGFGAWRYTTRVEARRSGERWMVRWRPGLPHPALDRETRLGTAVRGARRAPILDREGRTLMGERPVVDIAVEVDEVRDARDTAARLAALVDVAAGPLARRIRDARPGRFIPVITLRRADYERVADAVEAVPGASTLATTATLAPTRAFARPVLGGVGPVTAEQLAERDDLRAGDETGQWGLEQRFDERLAGRSEQRIVVRDRETGAALRVLARRGGERGTPIRTTLDRGVQAAAEQALGDEKGTRALVAVQPSTGDVLAVANRPADTTYDRGLQGEYPPGSTFKVVSTAALLRDGLDVGATVPCPPTVTVEGKSFRNYEGHAAGSVPFREDFAQSCNTAFVSLADRLGDRALTDVARDFGLGRSVRLALGTGAASVPPGRSAVERAAMMIGQDRIVATPLAMAGVAATVADGRWRRPRLLAGDPSAAGPALGASEVATLRELMRSVVTSGTGTALAGVAGEPAGKSGTAEYGGGDPPPTHAWFIAYRGDVAVAVIVEEGHSGAEVAAPIAARFLGAL
jgi:cell division protein FtsI/penicillin-binding protein 2